MNKNLKLMGTHALTGNLVAYIAHVNQIPMLTAQEEYDYAVRWRDHQDLEAAKALVIPHLRFVVKVARGYAGYGLGMADLIQEGTIGLMKAVRRFDPNVGVRLVTFAVHWIKAEMHEYIIRNWRIVKIATTKAQRKLFFNLRKFKTRLGWFTPEEIKSVAQALGVSTQEVQAMEARMNSYDCPYDASPDDDEDEKFYAPAHYLEDKRVDPAMQLEEVDSTHNNTELLHTALEKLDIRSKDIVQKRWLDDGKTTLETLAEKYHVSAERIRQLEKQAFEKLRSILQSHE